MITSPTPIKIPVQPWFRDHCFGGKIVLPAVETILLLAATVKNVHPERDIRIMEDARFTRFLEIPPTSTTVAALVDCSEKEDGSIEAKLLSRIQLKTMARIIEHGEIMFPASDSGNRESVIHSAPLEPVVTEVKAERIYRELVPFGPAYHSLQKTLFLSAQGAWGKLKAPDLPVSGDVQQIGSPFPLDGALHAACVHGQQYVDFVPFPVGFDRRIISNPTRPGGDYHAKIISLSHTDDQLVYDLEIFDRDEQVCETVTGVRMMDVSGGKVKPPAWIKATP